jgi:hypothetical protein
MLEPGSQGERRKRRVVARLPEPGAILRPRGPFERPAAEVACDLAEPLRLLCHAGFGAVEFEEQHRRLAERQFRIEVDRPYLERVEQLNPRNRDARLNRQDGGIAAGLDRRERADAAGDRLRDAAEPERQLGDDAERALGAYHQAGQVIARGGFLGPPCRGHQLAVRHHDFERQHIVLHRAVTHRVGAGAARRRHAA